MSNVIVVTITLLVMSTGLWLPQGTLVAYAIPCGINCENITNTPAVSVILNGSDQTVNYTLTFSLNNTVALGWNVSITSTRFTTGTTPAQTLPKAASSITGVAAVCTAGQICTVMPQNSVTYPITLPADSPAPTPVMFYNSSAATGLGTFDISTAVNVTVPANAYAGAYTSTITLTDANGP